MTYGIKSLTGDVAKMVVVLSCLPHMFMIPLILTDPLGVIASPYASGWWDPLMTILESNENVAIYPRIWATALIYQLIVRLNWVFTEETAPALYRCVLITYLVPFVQYSAECFLFKSLPPYNVTTVLLMVVPWLAILAGYPKYTREESSTSKND